MSIGIGGLAIVAIAVVGGFCGGPDGGRPRLDRAVQTVATVRFHSAGIDVTVHVNVMAGETRTLLSVARAFGVPVLFNCESGHCGACVVDVETHAADGRPIAALTDAERFVLATMDRMSVAEDAVAAVPPGTPHKRLACQYALGDEEISVSFESDLRCR